MKYKIGDKVKVKNNLKVNNTYGGQTFVSQMQKFVGRQCTIDNVYDCYYTFKEDSMSYYWTDKMLEPFKSLKQKYINDKDFIKECNMEKKLIGYKLNGKVSAEKVANFLKCESFLYEGGLFFTEKQLNGSTVAEARETGVLDAWFEPVYEEELKVGDYICVLRSDKIIERNKTDCIGDVLKITEIRNDGPGAKWISHEGYSFSGEGFRWSDGAYRLGVDFRKATKEEIRKASVHNIEIKGYKPKITNCTVSFGCKTYSHEFIIGLADVLQEEHLKMDYKDEIVKLGNYLKNL